MTLYIALGMYPKALIPYHRDTWTSMFTHSIKEIEQAWMSING